MAADLWQTWRTAADFDAGLKLRARHLPALREKQIQAEPYSRNRLFSALYEPEPVVFSDFHVPAPLEPGRSARDTVADLITNGFGPKQTARVQTGPSKTRTYLRIPELMQRWYRGRAIVSVTDLHIRDTSLETSLGVGVLSDFNLLLGDSDAMERQEMMTLVISARGNVTDSHSDDPDGSNHCFTGRKLWLGWETFEGKAAGLEDNSRDECEGDAAFDLDAFLSLPSARWWVVGEGQTLFLPGSLTHRVITLEHYLGVGSFFVALPSAIQTMARWSTHGALWTLKGLRGNEGLVNEITRAVTAKVRALLDAPLHVSDHWGLPYLGDAAARWLRTETPNRRAALLENRDFAELIEVCSREAISRATAST
jgi:hypothetical protein